MYLVYQIAILQDSLRFSNFVKGRYFDLMSLGLMVISLVLYVDLLSLGTTSRRKRVSEFLWAFFGRPQKLSSCGGDV